MLDCAAFSLSKLPPLRAQTCESDQNARVVLADDHPVYLLGLSEILTGFDLEVVAQTRSGSDALDACKTEQPDVLVFDARMFENSALLPEVRRWSKDTKIMLLIDVHTVKNVSLWHEVDVDSIVSKSAAPSVIGDGIAALLAGERYTDPEVAAMMEKDRALSDRTHQLTCREKQVLMLVVEGKSNRDVSEILGISAKTVDNHRTRMMAKLGVNSLAQLIALTFKEGLLERF